MKTRTMHFFFAATMMFVAAGNAEADNVDLAHVLQGGPSCDHVIRLMLRHGVNNNHNLSGGSLIQHSRFGPMLVPAAELGDLELAGVSQWEVVDPACGPKFVVTVRNNSTRDVGEFRITLVGLLGRIHPHAPTTVVKVDKICAGQAVEIQVQLPIEALAMGNRNGQVIGFQRLVVAIDSFDQFVESNETNNVKVIARTAIPVAQVVETTEGTATEMAPLAPADAAAKATALPAAPTAAPVAARVAPATSANRDDLQTAINQLSEQQQQPEATPDSSDTTL